MSLDDQFSVIGKVLDSSGNVQEFGINAGLQGQILTCDYNFPNVFTFADPIAGVTGPQGNTGPVGPTGPSNPNATNINITDTNTNATYYPTFVAGSGTQSLFADISTSAISFNVSNGDFNVVDTLKLTQTSVALGKSAGLTTQGANAVAVGVNAGQTTQGANSIAIGFNAGVNSQIAGSICLNASGGALNPGAAGFFVNPIRQVPIGGVGTNILYFNPATNEILRG
jgi:sorbitol-specific phosphotransferase system component IIA